MKLISIVFSFKDEEKNLLELVNRVTKVFEEIKNWNYELIFVNDASVDKSEEIYESPGRIMKLNSKIKQRNEEIKLKNQLSEEINEPDDKDVSESDN